MIKLNDFYIGLINAGIFFLLEWILGVLYEKFPENTNASANQNNGSGRQQNPTFMRIIKEIAFAGLYILFRMIVLPNISMHNTRSMIDYVLDGLIAAALLSVSRIIEEKETLSESSAAKLCGGAMLIIIPVILIHSRFGVTEEYLRDNAITEYQHFVQDYRADQAYFSLIYIDQDSIPELVISENPGAPFFRLFCYTDDRMVDLGVYGEKGFFEYAPMKNRWMSKKWVNTIGYEMTYYSLGYGKAKIKGAVMKDDNRSERYLVNGKRTTLEKYEKAARTFSNEYEYIPLNTDNMLELTPENIENAFNI